MEAVKLMRGPVGTTIELTIRRKGEKKPIKFKVQRQIIEVRSVEAKILGRKNNIGYIKLKSFNENSDKQFIKKIKTYEKQKKLVGYIIDLRNNPGGLLTQAIAIQIFLKMEK